MEEEIVTKPKKWGNSLGVILPKKLGITKDDTLRIRIKKENCTKVKDIWGTLKGKIKTPTNKLMKEIDEALDIKS